jgi:outer membrane pore protein F
LGVQYQGKNDRADVKTSNGDGVGYSLGYDFGEGFGAIASYSNANRTLNRKLMVKATKLKHGLLV